MNPHTVEIVTVNTDQVTITIKNHLDNSKRQFTVYADEEGLYITSTGRMILRLRAANGIYINHEQA